jgi:hypothetical protein
MDTERTLTNLAIATQYSDITGDTVPAKVLVKLMLTNQLHPNCELASHLDSLGLV